MPGQAAGVQLVAATAASVSGAEALFSATVSGGAAKLLLLQGNSQSDTVRAVLALPVRFKITRADNQPVASYPVAISALHGGRIGPTAAAGPDSVLNRLTGSDGTVTLYWRLGPLAGEQNLKIETPGLAGSPLLLKATATHAPPNRILAVDGDRQTGVVATKLAAPFAARVVDRYGNAIAGHPVLFRIVAGGGTLNGASQSQYNTTTDAAGVAKAQLTLGIQAGENISHIEAVSLAYGSSLAGSPLSFFASAKAGPPAFIFVYEGNQQSGTAGATLPQSLVVAVKDFYQNSVVDHLITFTVSQGNGKVNGLGQAAVSTNALGLAQVQFKLGTLAGAEWHQVTAQAQGLTTESALFRATAVADAAATLGYLSGNGQIALANNPLPAPFVVLVSDRFNNPVGNHPVQFQITAGGGTFDGEASVTVESDGEGRAGAFLTLGAAVGDSAHRATAASLVKNSSAPLGGSPVRFYAKGAAQTPGEIQRLELAAGDGQSGTVNQWLAQALRIRISDTYGVPVSGHPVKFRIARGNGRLGASQDTLITLTSTGSGEAEISWRLGTLAGDSTQAVEISCLNKANLPVEGSPLRVYAAARPGVPDISRSTLTVDSPVAADGIGQSVILTTVRDSFGNGIPNQGIALVSSGVAALIQPNQGYSSNQGSFQSLARSSAAGILTVQARVATSSQWLTDARTIEFIQPAAKQLELVGGDDQSAQVATLLADPLAVRVKDSLGRGLSGVPVRFTLLEGSADIIEAGMLQAASAGSGKLGSAMVTVNSDQEGMAMVAVETGTRSGRLVILATIVDAPESQLRFRALILPGAATELVYLSGSNQAGTAFHRLNQPLAVQARDAFANGVPGKTVTFSTADPAGSFAPSAQRATDSSGTASAQWYLGAASGSQAAQAHVPGLTYSPVVFAATALANHAPRLTLPDSLVISENEKWSYPIEAYDIEGDSIHFTIATAPEGLDLSADGKMEWQPSYTQAGRYALQLRAEDNYGAAVQSELWIIVADVNRPPQIDLAACVPQQQENIIISKPDAMDFKVAAFDPDNDALSYNWYVNGALRAQGKPEYRLQSELMPAGDVQVKVVVSDRKNPVTHTWSLDLTSAVWLSAFRAEADPGRGIQLYWHTRLETDNLGFFVQRAESEKGPFQTISTLLPASAGGEYRYLDMSAEAGMRYFYRLQDLSRDGGTQLHPAVQAQIGLPQYFALSGGYPNPFNSQTRLALSLPRPGMLSVEVIDLLGRSVRRICLGEAKAGYVDISWDGRDDRGADVASGVYYCRVVAETESASRKMVLVR